MTLPYFGNNEHRGVFAPGAFGETWQRQADDLAVRASGALLASEAVQLQLDLAQHPQLFDVDNEQPAA